MLLLSRQTDVSTVYGGETLTCLPYVTVETPVMPVGARGSVGSNSQRADTSATRRLLQHLLQHHLQYITTSSLSQSQSIYRPILALV
jgi:hypothetical protein